MSADKLRAGRWPVIGSWLLSRARLAVFIVSCRLRTAMCRPGRVSALGSVSLVRCPGAYGSREEQ